MARLVKVINRLMLVTILFSFVQYFAAGVQAVRAETTNNTVLASQHASATMTHEQEGDHIKWQANVLRYSQTDSRFGFVAADEQGKPLAVSSNQLTKQDFAGKAYAIEQAPSQAQTSFEFTTPASQAVTIYTVLLDANNQQLAINNDGLRFDTALAPTTQPAAKPAPKPATRESGGTSINDLLPPDGDNNKTIFTAASILNGKGETVSSVEVGEKIIIRYEWVLPEDVRVQMKAGDTFDFELPEHLHLAQQLQGDLKDSEGKIFGHYVVETDGKVRFEFSELVTQHGGVSGVFFISGDVRADESGGLPEITIPFVETSKASVPEVVAKKSRALAKEVLTKDYQNDIKDNKVKIQWQLEINKTNTALKPGTQVIDEMPRGVTYLGDETGRAYTVDIEGNTKLVDQPKLADVFDKKEENGRVVLTLKGTADPKLYYEIDYMTEVDLTLARPSLAVTEFSVKNIAEMREPDEKPIVAAAELNFAYDVAMAKTGELQANGTMLWTVTVDRKGGMTIPAGTVFTDFMDSNQVLTNASGSEFDDLEDLKKAVKSDEVNIEVTPGSASGHYNFKLMDEFSGDKFILKYYSKSTKTPSGTYNNRIDWGNIGAKSGNIGVKSSLAKTADTPNQEKGTVNFTITMNANRRLLTDLSIKDVMGNNNSPGLDISDAQLKGLTVMRQDNTTTTALVAGVDYEVAPKANAVEPYTEFTIAFKKHVFGDSGTTDIFIVKYESNIDKSKGHQKQRNTTQMNYKVGSWPYSVTTNRDVTMTPTKEIGGSKSGSINPLKGTIDWTMVVNTNAKGTLGTGGVLTDTLPITLNLNGGVSGTLPTDAYKVTKKNAQGEVVPVAGITAQYTNEKTTHNVLFTGFEPGQAEYTIVLTTSIRTDEHGRLPNLNAVRNAFTYQDDNVHVPSKAATVSYDPANDLLAKEASQNDEMVDYTIIVNRDTPTNPVGNKLKLKDVELVDSPDDYKVLRIDPDSLQVLRKDGSTFSKDDYHVDCTERGFTLKFKVTIEEELHVTYQAQILFPESSYPGVVVKPSNTVTITGSKIYGQQVNDKVTLTYPEAGGSAQGELGAIKVTKYDATNHETKLSEAVFRLYRAKADGSIGTPVTQNEKTEANGEVLLDDLPLGRYLLVETQAPDGYTIDPSLAAGKLVEVKHHSDGDNITKVAVGNSPATTYSGEKHWDDDNDQDGLRPSQITVHLLANGDDTKLTQDVSSATNWQYQFTNLPQVDAAGEAIQYSVKEDAVANYTTTYKDSDITNSYAPVTTTVQGTKTWPDDGEHPDTVVINLLADGEFKWSVAVGAANNWQYQFSNLPKYDDGREIVYTITENAVAGYTPTYNGYDVSNTATPGFTAVTVTKSWQDDNNQDGLRPSSVQVQLYANGQVSGDPVTLSPENRWTNTWRDLQANDNDGKTIAYTVRELNVPAQYVVTVNNENHGNIILTNTHEPRSTSVRGVKKWADENDQDGKRPNEVTVNLLADGNVVDSQKVSAASKWQYEFNNLPRFNDGRKISYTVTEDAVPGYSTEINGYDITNRYTPEKTSVTITKSWHGDVLAERPKEIVVQLLANGQPSGQPVTLRASDRWTYTWQHLPTQLAGQSVTYTVAEINVPSGYEMAVNNTNSGNILMANTKQSEQPGPEKPTPPVDPEKPTPPVDPGKPTPPVDPGKPVPPVDPGKPVLPGKPVSPNRPTPPHLPGGSAGGGGIGSSVAADSPSRPNHNASVFPQTGNERATWLAVLGTCLLLAVGTGTWLLRKRVKV